MVTASAFEVLGPIMVGPSSSHTAGALRIAGVARSLASAPIRRARFTLYESFARTHKGHGTDQALVAGLLGLGTDDPRIRDSFALARDADLTFLFEESAEHVGHPNTVDIALELANGEVLSLRGESVGGGRVRISRIEDVEVDISGEYVTVFVEHRDVPGVLGSITTVLANFNANIAVMRSYRAERGGRAYTVLELDDPIDSSALDLVESFPNVVRACLVSVPGVAPLSATSGVEPGFADGASLLAACDERGVSIGELMRMREVALAGSAEAVEAQMTHVSRAMREEVRATIERPERSLGGFLHGQAQAVSGLAGSGLLGTVQGSAVAYAMATLERSAVMGVIVAAPTAGSSGVVPGALLALVEARGLGEKDLDNALWCAAAIGAIVSQNATVSGAEGGCQAEVGTASAMAAAALAQLCGSKPAVCLNAAALALGNVLGLACDPAQGLVEFPCQNRNALGVANAYVAAQLALAGVASAAPFDEVVAAMLATGRSLPHTLRETAAGGLAVCPSVCEGCGSCR